MAFIINEQKAIKDNMLLYEDRVKSPVARFQDSTETYLTWWHLSDPDTTADAGFQDVASIIGNRSPLKYHKITNVPATGLGQIALDIEENDQGLDTNYEGEGVLPPNTFIPSENDFFMIPALKDSYLFRVTAIGFDTVISHSFYKFNFKLEEINDDIIAMLDNQVNAKFSCVTENIGTEKKCIIESEYKDRMDKIEVMYQDMVNTYMNIFYDDKHNSLLGDFDSVKKVFDPFQVQFINKHGLFNRKRRLNVIILTDQFEDPKRKIKYEKSIYRCIERRDMSRLSTFQYTLFPIYEKTESTFRRWEDTNTQCVDIPVGYEKNADMIMFDMIPDVFVESIKINGQMQSEYGELIKKFMRNEKIKLTDIPLTLNDGLLELEANLEVFFFTPILLYIIQKTMDDYTEIREDD